MLMIGQMDIRVRCQRKYVMTSTSVLARDDTFFGVCHAIGEDFGFSPTLLRIAFAGLLFWNPMAAVVTYVGAGLVVAVTRWFVPNPAGSARQVESGETGPEGANDLHDQALAWENLALAA